MLEVIYINRYMCGNKNLHDVPTCNNNICITKCEKVSGKVK